MLNRRRTQYTEHSTQETHQATNSAQTHNFAFFVTVPLFVPFLFVSGKIILPKFFILKDFFERF